MKGSGFALLIPQVVQCKDRHYFRYSKRLPWAGAIRPATVPNHQEATAPNYRTAATAPNRQEVAAPRAATPTNPRRAAPATVGPPTKPGPSAGPPRPPAYPGPPRGPACLGYPGVRPRCFSSVSYLYPERASTKRQLITNFVEAIQNTGSVNSSYTYLFISLPAYLNGKGQI